MRRRVTILGGLLALVMASGCEYQIGGPPTPPSYRHTSGPATPDHGKNQDPAHHGAKH